MTWGKSKFVQITWSKLP